MTRSEDPLGRLRYVPLATLPIGIAGLVLLTYGANRHAHGWVLVGALVLAAWGVFQVVLGFRLLRRLRDAKASSRGS